MNTDNIQSTIPPLTLNTVIALLEPHIPGITAGDIENLKASAQADDKFLKVKEAAIALNVSQITIRRMVSAGKLKAHKIGGSLRISYKSLVEMVENTKKIEGEKNV